MRPLEVSNKEEKMNKTKQTVIVNGRAYDVATGLPVDTVQKKHVTTKQPTIINDFGVAASPAKPAVKTHPKKSRSAAPHRVAKPQKSKTLRRAVLKKPSPRHRPSANKVHRRVQRSHHITKFAPHATTATHHQNKKQEVDPELAQQAKNMQKAHAHHVAQQEAATQPINSRVVKEHLLQKQLTHAPTEPVHHTAAKSFSRRTRMASVIGSFAALILLGGYLTYINIPNLSIKVAAINAGIDASLPRYQPGGFRLTGPIAYTDGEVEVKYRQAGGDDIFKITQRSTDWDPQATLDNYVEPDSNNDYEIHSAQGLTVYTYDQKAVWVNGGILHVIDGSAKLSSEQISRIAASM